MQLDLTDEETFANAAGPPSASKISKSITEGDIPYVRRPPLVLRLSHLVGISTHL